MILKLLKLFQAFRDRHLNRGLHQLEAGTRASEVLNLTREQAADYIVFRAKQEAADARIAARKTLRPLKQAAARKGVETRRARA